MNLKEKIHFYLKNSKNKKLYASITKEDFWLELKNEINKLNIDQKWSKNRKIWHYLNNTDKIPNCTICNINEGKWQYYKNDYGCCSLSCAGKQSLKTISKSIGVENQFQLESVKNKSKKTLIEKYGVDNISKLESIKEQKRNTMFKNYGRTNNFGENGELAELHMLNKYGVRNPAHLSSIAEKTHSNRYKKKHLLITPSGKEIFLQGFEVKGFKLLLDEGFSENDILYKKSDMPKIMYYFEGKMRRYYPDFFIKEKNIIIEIKSKYTYEVEKDKNDAKFLATKNNGYIHRLLILSK